MSELSEKIRLLREAKGIRPADVARSAGIKQSSYASIEKGNTKSISIEVGKGIAEALRISFNELFDVEAPAANTDNLLKNEELLKTKLEELNKKSEYQEKMIERYEKQLEFLYPIWYNYKASADAAERIVMEVILLYEEYLKAAKIPKLIPISLVSKKVRSEAYRLLKNNFTSTISEAEFEDLYQKFQQEINKNKTAL